MIDRSTTFNYSHLKHYQHQEFLSEMVESQWGPVHLFDLCLWFDHIGMALALAAHGVPGCILEDYHLGPISRDVSSDRYWDTRRDCSWAFPVGQGIWMEDWDAELFDGDLVDVWGSAGAIHAAQKAAATSLTRAMLDICSSDMELPFSGSPKTMARLLDIAILTGNQKAAVNLAKKSHLRPLRRWSMGWYSKDCWEAARTALWVGANFQDLVVKDDSRFGEDIPFPQALFLNSFEDWEGVRHLLPRCHDLWRPRRSDNEFGNFFFEDHGPGAGEKLSQGKIRAAEDAGVDVGFFFVDVCCLDSHTCTFVSLLDMAIWCGQPDCVEACVDRGIELKDNDMSLGWHLRVLRGESLRNLRIDIPSIDVEPSEAQIAAAAAGRAWLKRLWKSESSQKGIVLYQMMLKMFKGRSVPMILVQELLTYSMPVPKIIDQLDLREHVGDWVTTICGRPTSVHPVADCNTANVEDPECMQDNGEAGALLYIEVLVLFFLVWGSRVASGNHS